MSSLVELGSVEGVIRMKGEFEDSESSVAVRVLGLGWVSTRLWR